MNICERHSNELDKCTKIKCDSFIQKNQLAYSSGNVNFYIMHNTKVVMKWVKQCSVSIRNPKYLADAACFIITSKGPSGQIGSA